MTLHEDLEKIEKDLGDFISLHVKEQHPLVCKECGALPYNDTREEVDYEFRSVSSRDVIDCPICGKYFYTVEEWNISNAPTDELVAYHKTQLRLMYLARSWGIYKRLCKEAK